MEKELQVQRTILDRLIKYGYFLPYKGANNAILALLDLEKVLPAQSPRFSSSIRKRPRLTPIQPHIVTVFNDKILDVNEQYLVMDFAAHGSLADQRLLGVGEMRDIVVQISDALTYIHQCGYSHRDVKADTILI